mmetsp:Transcript_59761/g.171419  ORF Transcript_59761/g.171419 Transcript_59761/m.171419 type:complete len:296 (+) Transcript_59761:602-1489(+)
MDRRRGLVGVGDGALLRETIEHLHAHVCVPSPHGTRASDQAGAPALILEVGHLGGQPPNAEGHALGARRVGDQVLSHNFPRVVLDQRRQQDGIVLRIVFQGRHPRVELRALKPAQALGELRGDTLDLVVHVDLHDASLGLGVGEADGDLAQELAPQLSGEQPDPGGELDAELGVHLADQPCEICRGHRASAVHACQAWSPGHNVGRRVRRQGGRRHGTELASVDEAGHGLAGQPPLCPFDRCSRRSRHILGDAFEIGQGPATIPPLVVQVLAQPRNFLLREAVRRREREKFLAAC